MGRPLRTAVGNMVYHALNRANGRVTIFRTDQDYAAFEKILREARHRFPMRILAYCLMPNHWHLVLYPRGDDDLPQFMRWVTLHPYATLARSSEDGGVRTSVPRKIQVVPRTKGRALLAARALRGKECQAGGAGETSRTLVVVKLVSKNTRHAGATSAAQCLARASGCALCGVGERTATKRRSRAHPLPPAAGTSLWSGDVDAANGGTTWPCVNLSESRTTAG